ncbi:MAG: uroporphyrinogen decarboxylase family protein [Desulfobulbaceae bacterium]|uniref:Uroporphyrinogen decarboxylase family protein n=1 Tax=Candidatus Desulfatifera sulfidica TaxID=2841691 RepID=A0A8J6N9N7_9BACT|nr:uroporphyrinogen decarboxylase family protein [Candidatus Desulfatifera sulfidica]
MTSLQRVLKTLSHKEPDRVPLFLFLSLHGAKELGLSIKEYFSRAEHVVEGQLILREKYRTDCICSFFYAAIEVEAWGGEVVYSADGPPNSGAPFIRHFEDIKNLSVPDIQNTPCLSKVLTATRQLKEIVKDEAPIIGVVVSPFSLPVMQMGFPQYFTLMYDEPSLFEHLMAINEEFCVAWANAQLEAGATAICYFDPVSSTTVIPRQKYLSTGFKVAKKTISRINGPTATHFASGNCLPIINDIVQTGTAAVGTSSLEDLHALKTACNQKLTIIGNLNGVEMRRWSTDEAERKVIEALGKAASGGGFILSDNHGEIPWQVPDHVLMAISDAVHKWGNYPIELP